MRRSRVLFIGVMLMVSSVVFTQLAHALYLGTLNVGYFTGTYMPNLSPWGSVLTCGSYDPITKAMENKQTFINTILNYLSSGTNNCGDIGSYYTASNKIGAAFIIQTMRGQRAGTASRSPSPSDIADWENRVNASTIGWINNFAYTVNSGYMNSVANDDAFTDRLKGTRDSLVFYDAQGNLVYALKYDCGNPVGDLPGLPVAPSWNLTGSAYVNGSSSADALPGATVHFTYKLSNSGTGTASNIGWSSYQGSTKKSSGTVSVGAGSTTGALPNSTGEAFTIPTNASPGTQFCRYIRYPNQANKPLVNSTQACVTVLSNYDIYPNIQGANQAPGLLVEGASVTISPFTAINHGTTADHTSYYDVDQFVIPSKVAKPDFSKLFSYASPPSGVNATTYTAQTYSGNACNNWLVPRLGSNVITNCKLVTAGKTTFSNGTTTLPASATNPQPATVTINASDYNTGDTICVVVGVGNMYKYNAPTGQYRITYPTCYSVGKEPTVQVWGDDVHLGDNMSGWPVNNSAMAFTSHFTAKNSQGVNATFGSWAEYGIFAPARISSISGGAVSGQNGYAPAQIPGLTANQLSFANTGLTNGYPYGDWGTAGQIPSIEAFAQQYPVLTTAGQSAVNVSSLGPMGVGVSPADHIMQVPIPSNSSTVTKVFGDYTANGVAILESQGTVEISGDINLKQTTITSLGSAAQLIIIAKNIIVDDSVGHIDAWLVARPTSADLHGGRISTCDGFGAPDYFSGLTANTCTKQLQINGALIAREVQFRRTYGADKATGYQTPAEIVNLRADAFMWAQPPAGSSASGLPIETTFTTELPPRY